MVKKYIVDLTVEEREELQGIISVGKHSARRILRARILLKADQGWTDNRISEALDVSIPTLERIRKLFVEEGLERALKGRQPKNRRSRRRLDGKGEAQLIAIACGEAPEGRSRWTLRLLADKMVELGYVDEVSHETVRQVLKKTNSNRG